MKQQKSKSASQHLLPKKDLRSLSMDELMALAEQENIYNSWDLNKNGLIKALEKVAKDISHSEN